MTLQVVDVAGLVTIQDRGRFGWAHLGVPRGGALDAEAGAALANRILGNEPEAAVLEVTLGRLAFRLDGAAGVW
jgi:allophanate hydrolase subunit 2